MTTRNPNPNWYQVEFKTADPHMVEYFLGKNLAGCPSKVSGEEFIEWANAHDAPNEWKRWLVKEALSGLNGGEVLMVMFDGRTHPENIARLAVACGLDEDGEAWNNLLSAFYPHLNIHPRKELWDLQDKLVLVNRDFGLTGT